jgi:hypothetical protein
MYIIVNEYSSTAVASKILNLHVNWGYTVNQLQTSNVNWAVSIERFSSLGYICKSACLYTIEILHAKAETYFPFYLHYLNTFLNKRYSQYKM